MFLAVSLAFLASTASALGQSDLPPVTLVPAHPPGHDAYDLDHLVPDIQQSLHFRESGMSGMYHPSLPQYSPSIDQYTNLTETLYRRGHLLLRQHQLDL